MGLYLLEYISTLHLSSQRVARNAGLVSMLRTSPCVLSRKKPVSPFALLVFTNVKMKYVQIIRFINTTYTSSVSSTSVNPGRINVFGFVVRQF